MRGRELFSAIEFMIEITLGGLRLLPRILFTKTWWVVAAIPGIPGIGIRYLYLRRLAGGCGRNVLIGPGVYISDWHNLHIGSHVSIHRGCYIDARGGVCIGSNVSIAHGCSLVSFEHDWRDTGIPIRDNPLISRPILIEDDVWIGAAARLLAGVHVSTRVVVGAGAVVTGELAAQSVYAGVPARLIRSLRAPELVLTRRIA